MKSVNILVVDDDPLNCKIMSMIISRIGHNVLIANNSYEAIDIVNNNHIDIIITDLVMPGMDGYTLSRHIRTNISEIEYLKKHIPIIALTALDTDMCHRDAKSAGINDIITKPVSMSSLNTIINRHININNNLTC